VQAKRGAEGHSARGATWIAPSGCTLESNQQKHKAASLTTMRSKHTLAERRYMFVYSLVHSLPLIDPPSYTQGRRG
jgi:hypothetical protein